MNKLEQVLQKINGETKGLTEHAFKYAEGTKKGMSILLIHFIHLFTCVCYSILLMTRNETLLIIIVELGAGMFMPRQESSTQTVRAVDAYKNTKNGASTAEKATKERLK